MNQTDNSLTLLSPDPDLALMERADALTIWEGYRAQIAKLKATAETLTVTAASQTAEMRLARVTRLTLKDLRVAIEKRRKELGEDFLKRKQKIDTAAKELEAMIQPLETRLLEQEKFVEREAAEKLEKLKLERTAVLTDLGVNPALYTITLMSEEDFAQCVAGIKAAQEAKAEAERKAKAEQEAQARRDAEERERMRQENERLRAEAQEREAATKAEREKARLEAQRAADAARKEREAIEAKARQEQEAREKAERELKAVQDREKAERAAAAKAARDAAKAPDKEKLNTLAAVVRSMPLPDVSTLEGVGAIARISDSLSHLAAMIESEAAKL